MPFKFYAGIFIDIDKVILTLYGKARISCEILEKEA